MVISDITRHIRGHVTRLHTCASSRFFFTTNRQSAGSSREHAKVTTDDNRNATTRNTTTAEATLDTILRPLVKMERSLICPPRQRSVQPPTYLVQVQSHERVHPHVTRMRGRVQMWSLPEQCLDDRGPFERWFTTQGSISVITSVFGVRYEVLGMRLAG